MHGSLITVCEAFTPERGGEIVCGGLFKKATAMEMTMTGIKIAMIRYAILHPTRVMRYCTEGTQTKIPTPIPEEMMPIANPLFSLNQDWTIVILGTHPAAPNPTAVMTPKKR
jgi:hypothetical protein